MNKPSQVEGFSFQSILYILEVLLTINQLKWKYLSLQYLYHQSAFTELSLSGGFTSCLDTFFFHYSPLHH